MPDAQPLKAFIVGIHDEDDTGGWMEPQYIAAESPEHAIRLAFAGKDQLIARTLAGESDYSAGAATGFDHLVKSAGEMEVTAEDERNAGWHHADESSCSTCGLAPCGMDKYAVCGECDQCPECGHDEDCPEYEPDELEGERS